MLIRRLAPPPQPHPNHGAALKTQMQQMEQRLGLEGCVVVWVWLRRGASRLIIIKGYDVNKNGTQEVELAIPLKYLGNFWRALNIPLISCEVSLELKWDKNCIITSLGQRHWRR